MALRISARASPDARTMQGALRFAWRLIALLLTRHDSGGHPIHHAWRRAVHRAHRTCAAADHDITLRVCCSEENRLRDLLRTIQRRRQRRVTVQVAARLLWERRV